MNITITTSMKVSHRELPEYPVGGTFELFSATTGKVTAIARVTSHGKAASRSYVEAPAYDMRKSVSFKTTETEVFYQYDRPRKEGD